VTRFGRLDCLVNNAGSGSPMVSITEVAADHFSSVFDTNVRVPSAIVPRRVFSGRCWLLRLTSRSLGGERWYAMLGLRVDGRD
jgi:NAD(P)-dependent dehydrogenase (short-subunit alcohol dehydrogenase family)